MYSVNVKTEKFSKSIRFFDSQNAIQRAIEYADCVDVIDVMVMSEDTGEIGLVICNGKIKLIGIVDF